MKDLDYKDANVVLMVYCIDKESTFEAMDEVYETAKNHANDPIFVMAGNKVDLDKM